MSNTHAKYLTNTTILFDREKGTRLKYVLRAMGIDQTELASRLGVKQSCISKWVRGKVTHSSIPTGLFKSVLGKHFDYFLTGKGKEIYERFRFTHISKHGAVTTSHEQ